MPPFPPALPKIPADTSHLLKSQDQQSGIGPVVGIIIILLLLAFGGLYFWGASMNRETEPLPLIPADNSTQSVE